MSIKCGHCKDQHDTVAEVKACAGQHPGTSQPSPTTGDAMTERQMGFLNVLRRERGLEPVTAGSMTRRDASTEISSLLKTPKADPARMSADGDPEGHGDPQPVRRVTLDLAVDIPAGYYATKSLTGAQDLDFWLVQKGTDRWVGRTFVKRVLGGRTPERIRMSTQQDALKAIREAGPETAGILFGQQLGRCYKCGRHLTDETSRALSIGPDCRSKAAS